jgi:hypothetical protein
MLGRAVGDGSGQMECSECPARTIRLPVVVRPVLQSADCREVRERSYRARMAGWRSGPQRRRTARCLVAVRWPGLPRRARLPRRCRHRSGSCCARLARAGSSPGRETNEDGADRAPEVGQHVLIARRIGLVLLPLERPADTIHLRRLVSMLEEIWSRSWNSSKRTQPSNAARAASGKTTEMLQRRPPRLRPHFPRAGSKDRRPAHAGS